MKKTIIVLEDRKDMRDIITQDLEINDFNVHQVESEIEAMQMIHDGVSIHGVVCGFLYRTEGWMNFFTRLSDQKIKPVIFSGVSGLTVPNVKCFYKADNGSLDEICKYLQD